MKLLSKIKPFYFFISLFIGFLFTYLFTPMPDVIYHYPTPDNEDKSPDPNSSKKLIHGLFII